jgi:hypothetical protein
MHKRADVVRWPYVLAFRARAGMALVADVGDVLAQRRWVSRVGGVEGLGEVGSGRWG